MKITKEAAEAYRRRHPADTALDMALDIIGEWNPDAWWGDSRSEVFEDLNEAARHGDNRALELQARIAALGPTVQQELEQLLTPSR
jgi:hypothetical protein